MTANPLSGGHHLQLLQGGADFFPALLAAIDAATDEVRLETYIFHFDASGERVAVALERAAQRGVAVYLVMDGIGTPMVPAQWILRFEQAGVRWHRFSPLGHWGLLIPVGWRRLHRKLCVVDTHVAFCGGINILDDHVDPSYGALESPRYDFAVRVTGPLVAVAQRTMVQFWGRLQFTRQLENLKFGGARQTWKDAALSAWGPGAAATDRPALGRGGVS
ncbi:MAG: phospholipase D-like domain-containing protein, partial [Rhodoferax sp.]